MEHSVSFKSECNCNNPMCTSKAPIFSALSKEDLQKVYSLIVRYVYKKGENITKLGRVPGSFIIVKKGKIKIISLTPDGREQILYILTTGDYFGEHNLLRDNSTPYSALAMEDTILCTIGKADFELLLIKYPYIAIKVMEGLSDRLEHMESLVKTISPKDVDSRISMLLLDLSHRYGHEHPDGILIDIPMSREEMANCIGVARETLIRKLSLLKEKGIVEFIGHKKLWIKDLTRLETDLKNSAPFI